MGLVLFQVESTHIWHSIDEGAQRCGRSRLGSSSSQEEQQVWAVVGKLEMDIRIWRLWQRKCNFYRRVRRVAVCCSGIHRVGLDLAIVVGCFAG